MAAEDFNQRTEAFLRWFKSLPGATFSDSIRIVDFRSRNAGRGIIAVKDIEPDTTLFTIPRNGIINLLNSSVVGELLQQFDIGNVNAAEGEEPAAQFDSWSSLILVMIYEFLRGAASPWKPYFDVLPENFDTPMFWSDAELEELQASSLRAKIGKADAESMFRAQILPVIRKHPEAFEASQSITDEQLIGLAHRMGSTIMSYAFELEEEEEPEDESDGWVEDRDGNSMMGMVPMADILNADAEFNAHVNHGDAALTVTALRPIKAGEEILNYYGPHPNSELLRRYGYVTPKHSRYDVVELPWNIVQGSIAEQLGLPADVTAAAIKKLDEDDLEDTFVLERESPDVNPDGTFAGPGVLEEMPSDLMDQIKSFLKAVKKVKPDAMPDKRKRDDVSHGALASSLQRLESRYPTSIIEDENRLRQANLSKHLRMAIEVRLGEKQLIREAKDLISRVPFDDGTTEALDGANKKPRRGD